MWPLYSGTSPHGHRTAKNVYISEGVSERICDLRERERERGGGVMCQNLQLLHSNDEECS